MNHCLHAIHRVMSWADFDRRARSDERRPSGDWEAAALCRNVEAVGAQMRVVFAHEYQDLARWHPGMSRLGVWSPETLGCVVHLPGHWVALTRPEGAQTAQTAALMCDSLHRQPFALSAEEVEQLFAGMKQWQEANPLQQAGEWSVQRITLRQGVLP